MTGVRRLTLPAGWVMPAIVAALPLAVYSLWLAVVFTNGRDPRDFTIIDKTMLNRCHASSVIGIDPTYHYPPPNIGYDGAFFYMIALDPLHAACYIDEPSYRYTRILYPITAKVLALNQSSWIPATLILTNLLAIAGGTFALAAWLRRKGVSSWLALIYGFYPGLFVSLWRDLAEPLSYGLVALALYLFDFGGRRSVQLAGACFALAVLARETAAAFAVVYALALLVQHRRRESVELLGLALIPFALYKLVLLLWLGSPGSEPLATYPLQGLAYWWPWQGEQIDVALEVVVPALICTVVGLRAVGARLWTREIMSLLLNVFLLIVILPSPAYVEYYAAGRATTGIVLAALLCVPLLDRLLKQNRGWLWTSNVLWFLPWYFLVPLATLWADSRL